MVYFCLEVYPHLFESKNQYGQNPDYQTSLNGPNRSDISDFQWRNISETQSFKIECLAVYFGNKIGEQFVADPHEKQWKNGNRRTGKVVVRKLSGLVFMVFAI